MAISKKAVQSFLSRYRRDLTWMKEKPEEYIDEKIRYLPAQPDFYTKPFLHQKVAFLIGANFSQFVFLLDLGTGKSKMILDVLNYRRKLGQVKRALIVSPYVVSTHSWKEQVEIHAPNLKPVILDGPIEKRIEAVKEGDGDVFLVNYPGLTYMCSKKIVTKNGKRKMVLDPEMAREIASQFDMVIYDECQSLKSHQSLIYQVAQYFSTLIEYRYGMTGTLFGRDPHDVWAQFHVIDRGETMGETLGIFREAFFKTKKNYFSGWYDYVFNQKMKSKFHQFLKNRSIQYREAECNTLPDLSTSVISFSLPSEAYRYLRETVKEYVNGEKTVEIRGQVFVRLRQISSGYFPIKNKETGETHIVNFTENPRLEALKGLVESLPDDRKMVIFYEFTHSGDQVCRMLKKMDVDHERLYGGTKNHHKVLERFLTDPECRIFVVNSKSGAAGLNLQVANYMVFYESPVSPIVRTQAEKRCHRTGQKHKVFLYDIVCNKGPDKKIMGYLKEGKDLHHSLLTGETGFESMLD